MSRKHCYSFSSLENCDIFPNNTSASFENLFDLDNSEGEYYIALEAFIPGNSLIQFRQLFFDIELSVLKEQENGGCDRCITRLLLAPFKASEPVFIPLQAKKFSQIQIKLLRAKTQEVYQTSISTIDDHTWINFQVRRMYHGQKQIQLKFQNNRDIFPSNTPLHFTNLISPLFTAGVDFAEWEVALEQIHISASVLKKSPTLLYFLIYADIIDTQMVADKQERILANVVNTWAENNTFFSYRFPNKTFVNVDVQNFDRIRIDLDLFKNKDVTFKNKDEDFNNYHVQLTLVMRNKYLR